VFHLAKPEVRSGWRRRHRFVGNTPPRRAGRSARCSSTSPVAEQRESLRDLAAARLCANARLETGGRQYRHSRVARRRRRRRSASPGGANFVFWTLAEHCAEFELPFDLMIGVNRGVYPGGVFQGHGPVRQPRVADPVPRAVQRLPRVTFPISVLASVTNQELASYAWIFPNVVTNGHWWYSNTPAFIEHDLAARLEAVPRDQADRLLQRHVQAGVRAAQVRMYKRILAKVLAERFVIDRGWSEERAIVPRRRSWRPSVLKRNSASRRKIGPTARNEHVQDHR
jgi:hypothetical protein